MIIGIVSRRNTFENKEYSYLNQRYLDYFNKYNLTSILILDTFDLDSVLKLCDIFIIPGGYDIDPKYYHQSNLKSNISSFDDVLDFKVINYAYNNKKPLIGICKGIQVINVYFKGSLKQDMKNHMNTYHEITITNDLIYNESFVSNSYHHQSIDTLGEDLMILGYTDDYEIEILKHKNLPIFGFQYHPEIDDDINLIVLIKKIVKKSLS